MKAIHGLKFNQFEIVKHEEKPTLKAERFTDFFSGDVSISIHPYYEGGRSALSLMSSDDVKLFEDYKNICKEFNEEFDWESFYEQALRSCAEYYKQSIAEETERLTTLENKIKNLQKN